MFVKILRGGALIGVAAVLVFVCWLAWQRWETESPAPEPALSGPQLPLASATPVRLSPQARKNLKLEAKPLQPTTYWRTVEFPGAIIDRPGVTHRGVEAPVTGVVARIHAFPGDAIQPLAPLFTLRLVSDALYTSQLELFKAAKETELAKNKLARLSEAGASGALPESRLIEIQDQIERLSGAVKAYEQDLKARGLSPEQVQAAAEGTFLQEIVVRVPQNQDSASAEHPVAAAMTGPDDGEAKTFEVESLHVELGQQVSAGDVLADLADHRALLIEVRGFRDDMPLVQEAVKNGWEVETEFQVAAEDGWTPPPERLPIDHVSNSIDPQTRTFAFFLPLQNRWHTFTRQGKVRLLWQFRPGSQLRVRLPVEKFEKVFVLPQAAIVWEGPEAYAFRQNGEFYERRPVQVLYQDRLNAVIAPDTGLRPGFYVAQNAAASLNRIMKSQASAGLPAGMHVHPDGTVHAAH
jgi:multidrug efflux pump subunit AcrA (membrane-fusion protein)